MSEWISVDDTLPDEYGDYLVSRTCRPNGYVVTYAPVGWLCTDFFPVTHWMPLPEPPNTEQE